MSRDKIRGDLQQSRLKIINHWQNKLEKYQQNHIEKSVKADKELEESQNQLKVLEE